MPVLRALGVAWQFDSRRTAYLVSAADADDVEAALTAAGCRVMATLPEVAP